MSILIQRLAISITRLGGFLQRLKRFLFYILLIMVIGSTSLLITAGDLDTGTVSFGHFLLSSNGTGIALFREGYTEPLIKINPSQDVFYSRGDKIFLADLSLHFNQYNSFNKLTIFLRQLVNGPQLFMEGSGDGGFVINYQLNFSPSDTLQIKRQLSYPSFSADAFGGSLILCQQCLVITKKPMENLAKMHVLDINGNWLFDVISEGKNVYDDGQKILETKVDLDSPQKVTLTQTIILPKL